MTDSGHDERLGLLAEELAEALAGGEHVDAAVWAGRFEVDASEVEACLRALRAFDSCLGEETSDGRPELPLPNLPDSFEIEGELGRGGMGVVYRASQPALGRTVAVKVLRPGELQFGEALRRFRDEARSLARLRHRHIVSIHDVGETSEGLLWYAMDLVEGRTLADEIDEVGALTPSRAVRVMGQVTSAIAHAHAQGIVHRDLKPQNVLIDAAGDAYVVDFGLARDASTAGARTMTGELLGTPAYMSPEQAAGEHGRVGEAADIWALGALLYESLTGRGPFAGKPLHETIRAILDEEPKPARKVDPRVPAELDAVCAKALRKKPEQRYPTALAFGEELERFADGRGVRARNPGLLERSGRVVWRNRTVVGVGVLVALVLALLFGLFVVPEELRTSRIADARRSFEDGYAGAAVEPLRDVARGLGEDDPTWRDFDLLLLQASNARAAELLDAGRVEEARAVFVEGRRIAMRRWRSNAPSDELRITPVEREAWEFELLICRALAHREAWQGESPLPRNAFGVGVVEGGLHPRLFDLAWRHPSHGRRSCAEAVVWESRSDPDLARVDPEIRVEVLVHLHRRQGMWMKGVMAGKPDDGRIDFEWRAELVREWWSPACEDALADVAVDDQEDPFVRSQALRSLELWTGLGSYAYVTAPLVDITEDVQRHAATAPESVARWRSWRRLSREDALRSRIDAMVAGLSTAGEAGGFEEPIRLRDALSRWLGNEALGRGRSTEPIQAWWAARRERAVEEWVREDLGIPVARELDYADVLSSAAVAPIERSFLWRHLAWLRLPSGVRVPEIVACSNDFRITRAWLAGWQRGGGVDVDRRYVARLGVLMFRDIGAAPELIGEAEHPITTGEVVDLNWRRDIPVEFGPRVNWRSYGDDAAAARLQREHPEIVLPARQMRALVRCELLAGGEEPYLKLQIGQLQVRVPMDGGTHAARRTGGRIGIGQARAVEFDISYGGSLQGTLEFVLMVRLDPADALPVRGELATWREGYERLLGDLASADAAQRSRLGSWGVEARNGGGISGWWQVAPTELYLPSRWPMPAAREAIEVLAPERSVGTLAALWNAGSVDDVRDLEMLDRIAEPSAELWGFVALRAPTPELRSEGRERLRASLEGADGVPELSSPVAALLLEERADEIDPALAASLSGHVVGPPSPWLGGRFLTGLALLLTAAVGLAVAWSRSSLAGRAAWIAWLSAAALTLFRFETDSFVGPPLHLFLLTAAAAGCRVPRIAGHRGPRVLAAGVPLLLALWSFAAIEGLTPPPPEGALGTMLLPPFLGLRAATRPTRNKARPHVVWRDPSS